MKTKITFFLTDEQIKILEPLKKQAQVGSDSGHLGVALAQIHWLDDGRAAIAAAFVDSDSSIKMFNAVGLSTTGLKIRIG